MPTPSPSTPQPDTGVVLPPPESGFTTSEFATSLAVVLMAAATMIWHTDFNSLVPVVATATAGVSAAVLSFSRCMRKAAGDKAAATVLAARVSSTPAGTASGSQLLNGTATQTVEARRYDLTQTS